MCSKVAGRLRDEHPLLGKTQEFPNDVVHVEVTRPKSPLQVQEMNCDNLHPHLKFWWLNFPPKYWVVTVKSRILYTSLLQWKPSTRSQLPKYDERLSRFLTFLWRWAKLLPQEVQGTHCQAVACNTPKNHIGTAAHHYWPQPKPSEGSDMLWSSVCKCEEAETAGAGT